ncbi:hypothetical protein [Paractinoplanes rishiriensis]|uniref:Uncharacterized protein n=1 Tax=Paractinoplanes rishiriensis TaxID=1050105 RepID=A0A919K701_9ACTN|nr:hypothetical protein [Actinoplanes rishiriensis]GIF01234.1 hypothetical protein Ari01nite_86980 [Actinoplanes rishiriensis]
MQPLPDGHFVAKVRGRDSSVRESDYQLALAVVLELMQDARTRREPVRVSAQNDVVILTGTVGSWDARPPAAKRSMSPAEVAVVLSLWLVLPWLVITTAIPAVPAVLAAVSCTSTVLLVRYLRSRF